ncbi:MAG: M28 family metallopeptidase [Candidatus Cloacimonadales bacterium]
MIKAMEVVKSLDFERIAGSAEEDRAVEIISDYLHKLGLDAKYEEFNLTGFETGEAKIVVEGEEFAAHPYGLNRSTKLRAELIFLDNAEAVEFNRGAYRGKIVMSYGFSRGLANILKDNGVAGYIGIGRPGKQVNSSSHRQSSVDQGYVDSVNVDYATAKKLRTYSGKLIELEIVQEVRKRTARNIVVDIPGQGQDENLTLAVGHYDTVALSPGASDNTGGTVCLLKLAEYFSKNQPQRDLRIVFFSGEELGLLGSQAYVKAHLSEIKQRLGLVINIDVAGDPIGIDHFNVIGNHNLLGYIDGISKEQGFCFKSQLDIFSSDGMPFSQYEIPSVNIFRMGGEASSNIHTADDAWQYVSQSGFDTTIEASINLTKRILNSQIYPVKREIDSSLREKIEKYLYNLAYEKVDLEWKAKYMK